MATTSLWHIKGRLKDLIDYVENPEKTDLLYANEYRAKEAQQRKKSQRREHNAR